VPLGDFDICLHLTAQQLKRRLICPDDGPVYCSENDLTVRAMTKHYVFRINLGFISDMAAMTPTINFYSLSPVVLFIHHIKTLHPVEVW